MSNLYQHQKQIIDKDPKKCGLFLGTGSGKTRIALLLARGKTLVICPKTQKEDENWEREWQKLAKGEGFIITDPDVSVTVISKETFRRDWRKLPKFDTVIVDEAHTCLGVTPNIRWIKKVPYPRTSQLFEALAFYKTKHEPERFYLCTATIIKSPMTVWGAGELLLKNNANFYDWRDRFYYKLNMPGREIFMARTDTDSKKLLASFVKKLGYVGQLQDYFDVPEQTYRTIHLELTDKQKRRIKELPLEYPDPLVLTGKKHQVENGVLAGDEYNKAEQFENAKIEKILELSLEFPRMVIFAKYRNQIDHLKTALEIEGRRVLTLTGDTKDRGNVIKEANDLAECIFIAQAQVSSGWELPDYPVMVFASMSYSVVDRIQGEGRILRANRLKKNLYIDLVVKGGVDEAVHKCISNKKDFNEQLYVKTLEKI